MQVTEDGKSAKCDGENPKGKQHSFDFSADGYLSFGVTGGDSKAAVAARREFLRSTGAYATQAQAIVDAVKKYAPDCNLLVDAGCGEGYYTEYVARKFALHPRTRVVAFDISKDAAKRCARRIPEAEVAVASSYHMPLSDSSVDVIINTFSPLAIDEVRRVLRVGGRFIMAIPGEEHLFGLKSAIYDIPYKNKVEDTAIEGFSLLSEQELKYTVNLNTGEDIRALFMMTPYAYRTNATGRERVFSLKELSTAAHFHILTYERL